MALLTPAIGLAACARPTKETSTKTWYVDHQDDLLKEVEATFSYVRPLMVEAYGESDAEDLYNQTMDTFKGMLPGLPYIGGFGNELTSNLGSGASALAFYQVLKARGEALDTIGRLLYKGVERQMSADPMVKMMGSLANSKAAQEKLQKAAEQSQEATYPEDWVFTFVSGEGQDFDFGIDYTECGICKYFQSQGAEEFTPYLCLLDAPISQAMGSGLVRTQTLARGDERCDFRYKTGRDVEVEWNPGYVRGGK